MELFYVLVRRGINGWSRRPVCLVSVKTAAFFLSQRGHLEEWGKAWQLVEARSIAHAEEVGKTLPLSIAL